MSSSWASLLPSSPATTKHKEKSPVICDSQMTAGPGKAKMRHVGGWAIRKLLKAERKYARGNIDTQDSKPQRKCKNLSQTVSSSRNHFLCIRAVAKYQKLPGNSRSDGIETISRERFSSHLRCLSLGVCVHGTAESRPHEFHQTSTAQARPCKQRP